MFSNLVYFLICISFLQLPFLYPYHSISFDKHLIKSMIIYQIPLVKTKDIFKRLTNIATFIMIFHLKFTIISIFLFSFLLFFFKPSFSTSNSCIYSFSHYKQCLIACCLRIAVSRISSPWISHVLSSRTNPLSHNAASSFFLRSITINAQTTPNPLSMKFVPDPETEILPKNFGTSFVYLSQHFWLPITL